MQRQNAKLILEDGTIFEGESFGKPDATAGEVVFLTGMVGYPESLTDPSYRGQILVFTYPLIGNYGIPEYREDEFGLPLGFESSRIQAAGVVIAEPAFEYSHYQATRGLEDWLLDEGIPGIAGIDTRALTKRLRSKGTMLGKIITEDKETGFYDPNTVNLVSAVSVEKVTRIQTPKSDKHHTPTIVVVDCGCKASILRSLLKRDLSLICVPHDHYFLNLDFDGVVVSNGPGDPKFCTSTKRHLEHALAVGKPILGICMGSQLLGLAAGADTYKLKFGHRSQNQPCLEIKGNGLDEEQPAKRCYITSQNHGYAVRKEKLPGDWRTWFVNANDKTVEGIRHATKPFWGVQFHPEAHPGPVDSDWIFDDFANQVRSRLT